jgi:hypothetical protein
MCHRLFRSTRLWLHFRFWNMSPKLYFTIENRLPATFGAGLGKEARIGVFMYYLAVLFANKHLDDFSYRNSSWCVIVSPFPPR